MFAGIADTHVALWHLFGENKLSVRAADFIEEAADRGQRIGVSAISLAELVYLVEKGRLPREAYTDLKHALIDPDHVLKEVAFTIEVVEAMRQVERSAVPDLPDRIVAATAVYFRVPVLSRDGRIRSSGVEAIW